MALTAASRRGARSTRRLGELAVRVVAHRQRRAHASGGAGVQLSCGFAARAASSCGLRSACRRGCCCTRHHRPHLLESGLQTANRSVPRTCSTSSRAPTPSRVTRDALYARGVGAPYPPLSSPFCAGPPVSLSSQPQTAELPISQYCRILSACARARRAAAAAAAPPMQAAARRCCCEHAPSTAARGPRDAL
jgi:hypothetical protein